jgi:5-methylcytosine-specific restriction endonuclease McrA
MASAFVEDVRKAVIAERDRWKCQLCGKKVNKTLRAPHPMSWSIDHIVAISVGGEHSYANTQLAHLGCNVAKGHRTRQATQLALIG